MAEARRCVFSRPRVGVVRGLTPRWLPWRRPIMAASNAPFSTHVSHTASRDIPRFPLLSPASRMCVSVCVCARDSRPCVRMCMCAWASSKAPGRAANQENINIEIINQASIEKRTRIWKESNRKISWWNGKWGGYVIYWLVKWINGWNEQGNVTRSKCNGGLIFVQRSITLIPTWNSFKIYIRLFKLKCHLST